MRQDPWPPFIQTFICLQRLCNGCVTAAKRMTLAKENAPSASLWMETGYMYRLAATDWPQRPVSSAQPGLQASGETRRVEGLAGHVRCVALLAQRKRLAGIFCVSCPCAVSLSCDRSVCLSWRVEIWGRLATTCGWGVQPVLQHVHVHVHVHVYNM